VVEGFFVSVAPWAGFSFDFLEPGAAGGQGTFPGSYLVERSRHAPSQGHEEVRREAGGEGVVRG